MCLCSFEVFGGLKTKHGWLFNCPIVFFQKKNKCLCSSEVFRGPKIARNWSTTAQVFSFKNSAYAFFKCSKFLNQRTVGNTFIDTEIFEVF